MDENRSNPMVTFPRWEPKLPLDMVIAYEDDATRDSAISLCKRLTETLIEHDVQCSWWPIPCLLDAKVTQEAVDAAVGADLILISLRSGEIPREMRPWVENWKMHRQRRPCALVLVVHQSEGTRGLAENYLRNAAKLTQMDFFLNAPSLEAQLEPYSVEKIQERAQAVTPLLANIMSPRYYLRGSPIGDQPLPAPSP